jgi:hypothetical protein
MEVKSILPNTNKLAAHTASEVRGQQSTDHALCSGAASPRLVQRIKKSFAAVVRGTLNVRTLGLESVEAEERRPAESKLATRTATTHPIGSCIGSLMIQLSHKGVRHLQG